MTTTVTDTHGAELFDLAGVPLLSAGRTNDLVASTDLLAARIKIYAEGGENGLHTHVNEDHLFLILAGEATFHLGSNDEAPVVVRRNQGVLIPAGTYYRFVSSGDENLALFRVGAVRSQAGRISRVRPDGNPLPSRSDENGYVEGVPVPGRTLGDL